MSKISIYEVVPVPKLADKLVGTSVGGYPKDVTYNFTLSELLNLFIPNIPQNTLQGVLDYGNTAVQNINLTGIITTTTLTVGSTANILNSNLTGQTKITGGLYDRLNSIGTAGQVLTSTGTKVEWYTIPTVIPDLQQVLASGNTAVNNIVLTGNLSANNAALLTSTITTSITVLGTLKDGLSAVGANNQVLSSNVTGVRWINLPVYSATSPLIYNGGTGAFSIQQANATQNGYLSYSDWITFDGKQTALSLTTTGNSGVSTLVGNILNIPNYTIAGLGGVPQTRTLTINGVTYNLSADRTWTIASGVSSVSATVPLFSTGGPNPDISIQIATNTQEGYLDSVDWNTFNNKQPAGNYITSLTGEATGLGPGAATVVLGNAAVIGKILTGLNITGSVISSSDSILTAFGKVQNQINGLIGGVQFQGVWNANTNTPTLTSSVGTQGYYYIVSVAGTTNLNGITDWQVGDWAIFNGSTWNKVDNTDLVTSVNGFTGAVSLTTDNIPEGATNLYYLDSRARAALSFAAGSGAYNGTTGAITIPTDNNQILNGAGYITLVSLSATSPLTYNNTTGAFAIQVANTTQNGYLSSADWNTFNGKQPFLGGTGLVKSVAGVISYITDNSANWNTAYNDSIVSAAVTGTSTKTLTLTQQDAGTITASWSDIDTGLTSVGVSMPTAFTVTNSPLTANGVIGITGSGIALQYIDGTGALQTFPILTGYVPYTGATSSVNLGIYNLTAASLIKNGGTVGQFLKADGSVDSSAYIVLGSLSATAPLSYNNTTGAFTISQSGTASNGYLSSTDWNTFNSKEPAIIAGTTLQYYRGDKTFQTLNTTIVPEGTNLYYLDSRVRTAISLTTTGSSGVATYNNTTGVFNIPNYGSALSGYVPTSRLLSINGTQYDLSSDRSWSVGTVTSVAALTLGTSGTDLSSSVATSSTTPVITLNVPTASAVNRGVLSAADWNTFNGKQAALSGTGFVKIAGTTISYDNSTYLTTIAGITAGGELSGTYASPSLVTSAVTGKLLTGVNITGGTVLATDTMLTAFGKLQNQINGLIGGSIYRGVWNASTNTPTLVSSVGTSGDYYIVSVAGTTNLNGITDWQLGDWAIFNGGTWQKVDNSDSVSSVNGFTGAVSLTTANISEATNLYFTNARAIASTLTGYTSGAGTIAATDTILSAIQKLNGNVSGLVTGVSSVNSLTGAVTLTTTNIGEGTNLYYTEARVNANTNVAANTAARHNALTIGTANGLSLSTQVLSLALATTSVTGALSSTDWTTFNNKQSTVTLTTTGTSGVATFSANTLNIPNYGSALSGYLPLTGGTLTGALNIGTISSGVNVNLYASSYGSNGLLNAYGTDNILKLQLGALGTNEGFIYTGSGNKITFYSGGVVALTLNSNQTTTLTGALTGTSATFSGDIRIEGTQASIPLLQISDTTNSQTWNIENGRSTIGTLGFYNGGTQFSLTSAGAATFSSTVTALDIYAKQATGGYVSLRNGGSGASGYLEFISNNGTTRLGYLGYSTTNIEMTLENSAKFIVSGGNVGIGTISPVRKLDIVTTGEQLRLAYDTSGNYYADFRNDSAGGLLVNTSSAYIIHYIASTLIMRMNASGDVGIGNNGQAGYKLDVSGTARFTGALTGTSATFSGGGQSLQLTSASDVYLNISRGASFINIGVDSTSTFYNTNSSHKFYTNGGTINALTLASSGAATFSSSVNSLGINTAPTSTNASANFIEFRNTGGDFYVGQEGSAAGGFFTGSSSYASIFYSSTAQEFIISGSRKLQIATSGAATFSSSVTATGFFESSDMRIKTLIQNDYQAYGIGAITPKLYTKNGKVELGYYAQDFIGILDSAISKSSDDMLSLSYREVHTAKIYALEKEIKELKAKLN